MGGLNIVRVAADEELNLVSGSNLEAYLGGTPDLQLQGRALVVGPGRAVSRELAAGRPGKRGLAGERSQAFEDRHQPDIAGWGGEASWPYVIPSCVSNTANSEVTPTPRLAACASRSTGTVRERGIPLLSAQAIVTPATPELLSQSDRESGSTGLELRSA